MALPPGPEEHTFPAEEEQLRVRDQRGGAESWVGGKRAPGEARRPASHSVGFSENVLRASRRQKGRPRCVGA